jgi:hypothetical protein
MTLLISSKLFELIVNKKKIDGKYKWMHMGQLYPIPITPHNPDG